MNADDIPADATTFAGHTLEVMSGTFPDGPYFSFYRCSCGAKGKYGYRTDEEMHRAWRWHVARRIEATS